VGAPLLALFEKWPAETADTIRFRITLPQPDLSSPLDGVRRWSSFRAYFLGEAGPVRVNEWAVLKMKTRPRAA
jgi:hypothetical protein